MPFHAVRSMRLRNDHSGKERKGTQSHSPVCFRFSYDPKQNTQTCHPNEGAASIREDIPAKCRKNRTNATEYHPIFSSPRTNADYTRRVLARVSVHNLGIAQPIRTPSSGEHIPQHQRKAVLVAFPPCQRGNGYYGAHCQDIHGKIVGMANCPRIASMKWGI